MVEPKISVGILSGSSIEFELVGKYIFEGEIIEGKERLQLEHEELFWRDNFYREVLLTPIDDEAFFILKGVTIGIDFHWEQREEQSFKGALKFKVIGPKIWAINIIDLESYLKSVISSEMSATAPVELLKAHAIISRSWLIAQISKDKESTDSKNGEVSGESSVNHYIEGAEEWIRWWDREDHIGFDICADDHCQRYQGISTITTESVGEAVEESRGMVLTYRGEICDARYSKCCGGALELFQNCWGEDPHPYLVAKRDWPDCELPNLSDEGEAREWIGSLPDSFCNVEDSALLEEILNSYDQLTPNFYRWSVTYSEKELTDIVTKKSGLEWGKIVDLIPIERGSSGRIVRLKIVSESRTLTVGKELFIRTLLSESHLYSSAFIVEKSVSEESGEQLFTLRGAGWGHGVGLCQIGAAVMGSRGYSYEEILHHYFVGAKIDRRY